MEEIKRLVGDISVLNYQQNNFQDMQKIIKDEVIEGLQTHLRVYNWVEAQKELLEDYDLGESLK